ncbi:glycosyltransferase family 4 protein [Echinicola sediminis]
MKKVLIISPHFPPVNAADMHRVRQGLPYFSKFGWEPTILYVDENSVEMSKDPLLKESVPSDILYHKVKAFSTKYTRKLGLGNLGLRAFFQLLSKGNQLLKDEKFDLVYFSTTVFACMPLGRIWKMKFGVPYVIDMQDPWRNDYYLSVPKEKRPPKFWFAYRLDKYLEAFTMPKVDGLISVSKGYVEELGKRYDNILKTPYRVLTFGAYEGDFDIAKMAKSLDRILHEKDVVNFIYIGRGGKDMKDSLELLFQSFSELLDEDDKFKKCRFWFIGTSYAPDGKGEKTIEPIAESFGVESYVKEITDRLPYFNALATLKMADIILIPGSNDKNYTASKLYPNILAKKPLLSVFHSNSSVVNIMEELEAGEVILFDMENALENLKRRLDLMVDNIPYSPNTNWDKFYKFTAENMTREQCEFFDLVVS